MYPLDDACKDGARLFYPCTKIVSDNNDSEAFTYEVVRPPPCFENYSKERFVNKNPGQMNYWLRQFMKTKQPIGGRNKACYIFGREAAKCQISIDKAYSLILQSVTYRDQKIEPNLESEILRAVTNGHNSQKVG